MIKITEEVSNVFKVLSERLKESRDNFIEANYKTDILSSCGCNMDSIYRMVLDGMSTKDALQKVSDVFNETNNIKLEPTIEQLKKQIKYSQNALEIKMFNRKLNELYKTNSMKL